MLHGAPAAVLLIDLVRRQIVNANATAVELAGERIGLPVDVDPWSDAASLTDLGGKALSDTTSPLSMVAAGVPVAGEPVAVREATRDGAPAIGVAVGDVVGHDLRAAAAMGKLRGVVRSYAWDGGRPGSVLDRCDQLVQGLEMAAPATAVYARLVPPDPDGSRLLRYANAGHPTPLLLTRSSRGRQVKPSDATAGTLEVGEPGGYGQSVRLDGHRSPMIGVLPPGGPGRGEAEIRCPPGSLVLLYTVGLTDVAGADADTVLAACKSTRLSDDIALLAVRLDAQDTP